MRTVLLLILTCGLFGACSPSARIHPSARQTLLENEALRTAHVGISIYEPATGRWWYNWQGDKYFVPASNTKLATCYAAMKYLGDSLAGLQYTKGVKEEIEIKATGDPTFLHPDFKRQPVYDFLKQQKGVTLYTGNWKENAWGSGWSWSDYDAAYMAERSPLPVFGNLVQFTKPDQRINTPTGTADRRKSLNARTHPAYFQDSLREYLDYPVSIDSFRIERELSRNAFRLVPARQQFTVAEVPFVTNGFGTALQLLEDTLHARIHLQEVEPGGLIKIYSQPTDSLLKPMMHRSDNFFAEQSLLMVSNEVLGFMNEEKIIDTLLKTDFKDLPQKPRWVDGSGLSRYNLFTPQDFVMILDKMQREFGINRIRDVLPTGGEGTLANYYKADSTLLYAKTGTLSGAVALSGFLTTKNGRELIFSVLVNNNQAPATLVRRAVEGFLQNLRKRH